MAFVSIDHVFADRLAVLAVDDWGSFACLSSSLHDAWAHRPGTTTHETRNTYFNEQAFETFCFPIETHGLVDVGRAYESHRKRLMRRGQEGLRDIYNRVHNGGESAAEVQDLRDLHVEMDKAVAVAYGWHNLDLGHGFHETKQGIRFTISESARRDVLSRLLKLNHERYAEEVARGLHNKEGKGAGRGAGSEEWGEGEDGRTTGQGEGEV